MSNQKVFPLKTSKIWNIWRLTQHFLVLPLTQHMPLLGLWVLHERSEPDDPFRERENQPTKSSWSSSWRSRNFPTKVMTLEKPSEGSNIWVFPKIGVFPPKWMVKIMENPTKMDDLGGKPTIFGNTFLSHRKGKNSTSSTQKWRLGWDMLITQECILIFSWQLLVSWDYQSTFLPAQMWAGD